MTEDILEKAKDALDHAISESSGGVYLDPSCNDLLPICRELIAEVERLQDLIDKPPEEADWKADMDFVESEMGSRPYPAIVATTYKWLKAYRKAQNSNLIRRQQNKRLEAERALYVVPGSALEAALSWIEELKNDNKRLEAEFLEAKRCPTCNGAGKLIDVVISRKLGRVESERVCPLCEGKWEEKARQQIAEELPEVDWE